MSNLSQKMLMAAAGGSELQPNIEDVFHIDVYGGDHNSSSAGSDRTMPLNNVNLTDYGGLIWARGATSTTEFGNVLYNGTESSQRPITAAENIPGGESMNNVAYITNQAHLEQLNFDRSTIRTISSQYIEQFVEDFEELINA